MKRVCFPAVNSKAVKEQQEQSSNDVFHFNQCESTIHRRARTAQREHNWTSLVYSYSMLAANERRFQLDWIARQRQIKKWRMILFQMVNNNWNRFLFPFHSKRRQTLIGLAAKVVVVVARQREREKRSKCQRTTVRNSCHRQAGHLIGARRLERKQKNSAVEWE